MNNWKNDPDRRMKEFALDIVTEAINKLCRDQAPFVSLADTIKVINDWFKKGKEINAIKYKPCCSRRCMLGSCATREAGGCYHTCGLVDAEKTCLSLMEGTSYRQKGGIIYIPGRLVPLEGDEKAEIENQLANIRERLKEYEINDEA